MREAPCFFSGGGRERKGMDRILILLMEQVTVRTQLTITRKVRIQIARTEKNGYPASICVSVNDEVVHGIPHKDHIIQEGDIVSITLDEDGNAAFITVMSMEMGG